MMLPAKVPTRLSTRVVIDERGCWNWPTTSRDGYGSTNLAGKRWSAHQGFYFILVGNPPRAIDGTTLDHLCRTRACVNPAHLEVVPRKVNILRGISPHAKNARKTACVRGHPFAGENIEQRPLGRGCLTCKADRRSMWYQRDLLRRYPVPMMTERLCRQCGRPFPVSIPPRRGDGKRRFCSDLCGRSARQARRAARARRG
jgi:hypothetical protein